MMVLCYPPKALSEFEMFNPTILLYEFDGVIRSIGRNVSLLDEISLGDTEAEESLESTPPPGTPLLS